MSEPPAPHASPSVSLARAVRRHCVMMCHAAAASHIGSNLSCCDLLAVLYADRLRVRPGEPNWPDRDRLIMSKGHAAAVVYATLAERGFFAVERLAEFCRDGSALAGHVHHDGVPGVEMSTGSLGHGLPIGCGLALAARHDRSDRQVFVILSDGECDEGTTWESALFAAHHRLGRLTAILDVNGWQSFGATADVLDLEPLAAKWRAFRWDVVEIDGHDHDAIRSATARAPSADGPPRLVLARTLKGRGVSFMEDRLLWHYKSPDDEDLHRALAELEAGT